MKTMREELDERVILEAKLFLEEGATIRSVAQQVGMSKSNVSLDLRNKLAQVGRPDLVEQVNEKLDLNRLEAPLRGGNALHRKISSRGV